MIEQWFGKFVIVRTHSAGVHVGVLRAFEGRQCVLSESRKIWSWKGRNTLYEIALRGVGRGSRVSEPSESAFFTEVIQILPTTSEAEKNLRTAKWDE